ncbi:MFS transporter [Streptomyces sp. NPDC088253]|uniref:MFS transporter n=1 Tax=Streptomyces sp. NPDC088253 TaxID=3365846 RepID=UPI00380E40B6
MTGPGTPRRLVAAHLLGSVGFGLYASGSAVYFTRQVGLPVTQVGAGLTLAGLVWLPLSLSIGRLCDRIGARRATVGLGCAQVLLLVAATEVHSLWTFLVLAALLGICVQGGWICREALVADLVDSAARVNASARLRSVFNIGVIAGALGCGLALSLDSAPGYLGLILGSALAEAAATACCLGLPDRSRGPALREDPVGLRQALRDLPYLALSLLYGVLAVGDIVLRVGIPLWVVAHAGLPKGLGAWLYGLNAVLVVGLQVRLSRGAESFTGARRLLVLSGAAAAGSCAAVAVSGTGGALPGTAALVAAVLLLSLAELWSSAAGWKLRFDLAPARAQGTWGGLFALGSSVNLVLGPAAVTLLVSHYGAAGWLLLGLGFLGVTVFCAPALAWALRTRPGQPAAVSH